MTNDESKRDETAAAEIQDLPAQAKETEKEAEVKGGRTYYYSSGSGYIGTRTGGGGFWR
jgi:hypothetical protein